MRVTVGETPYAEQYRCWVDEEEVTNICFSADSDEGWATCFVPGPDGKPVVDLETNSLPMVRRFGVVRLERH